MKLHQFLYDITKRLTLAGIDTARLDCLLLLEDALGKDRALLLAHPEIELSEHQVTLLNTLVIRREHHEPLAYIRGRVMFYGRGFAVNNKVLVPRPESENVITMLKTLTLPGLSRIADMGTGSGCLGITAALEILGAHVYLYDIDSAALKVAQSNARAHKVVVHTSEQDLLKGCTEHFDVILANLPYVPDNYPINTAAQHEPKLALFAGPDGLDMYRTLWQQLKQLPAKPTYVITEALLAQHRTLATLAQASGYTLAKTQGLAQTFTLKQ